MLMVGSWPVLADNMDYTTVDEVDSGISAMLQGVSINPCTKEALLVGYSGTVYTYDWKSLPVRIQTNTQEILKAVAWKPDCSEALVVGGNGVVLLYKNGNTTPLQSGTTDMLQDVTWTNDGKAVIVADRTGVLWWDGNKFYTQAFPDTDVDFLGIAWKPNGNWGVVVGGKLTIYRFDWNSTKRIEPPLGVDRNTTSLYKASWRPDGSKVTMVGQKGTILDYDGTSFIGVTSGGSGYVVTFLGIRWRPTGEFAVIVGDARTIACYEKENSYPHLPSSMKTGLLYGVDWTKDGSAALIDGNNGVVLRYPAKAKSSSGIIIDNAMVTAVGVVLLLFAIGVVYLFFQERKERMKDKAKKEKHRSHRHGRRSRHRR